jgi:hypothetical protein
MRGRLFHARTEALRGDRGEKRVISMTDPDQESIRRRGTAGLTSTDSRDGIMGIRRTWLEHTALPIVTRNSCRGRGQSPVRARDGRDGLTRSYGEGDHETPNLRSAAELCPRNVRWVRMCASALEHAQVAYMDDADHVTCRLALEKLGSNDNFPLLWPKNSMLSSIISTILTAEPINIIAMVKTSRVSRLSRIPQQESQRPQIYGSSKSGHERLLDSTNLENQDHGLGAED